MPIEITIPEKVMWVACALSQEDGFHVLTQHFLGVFCAQTGKINSLLHEAEILYYPSK